jgi:parvulin-like peptidyl-prolyl isomerase
MATAKAKSKSTTVSKKPETSTVETNTAVKAKSSAPKKNRQRLWLLIGGLILLLLVVGYQFKNRFVVVLVNGQPITRAAYVKELEAQGGTTMLQRMITERLVTEEAAKQNINVGQEEIDQEIQKIEENLKTQGQTLEEALAAQNMTLAELQKQIRISKLITALTASQVMVTDADVQKYIADNKDQIPTGKDAPANLNDLIKKQLEQTKQQEVTNTWLDELQKKANIQYW